MLDFGCGSGRVLREFLPEAASGEFWGCDLHRPTIAWLDQHLSPPLRFYVNDRIPTPHPDSYFDLVYAISVFTHITHEWSAWLLELHRILKPEGLLLATFCGPRFWEQSLSRPPDENELGMCVQRIGRRPGDDTSGAPRPALPLVAPLPLGKGVRDPHAAGGMGLSARERATVWSWAGRRTSR